MRLDWADERRPFATTVAACAFQCMLKYLWRSSTRLGPAYVHPFSVRPQAQKSRQNVSYQYSTKLFYMVHIRPRGPVPVLALEWQISSEVPNNLAALKETTENATPEYLQVRTCIF